MIRTERSPAKVTQMVGDARCESHFQVSPLPGLGRHCHNRACVEKASVGGSLVSLECLPLPLSPKRLPQHLLKSCTLTALLALPCSSLLAPELSTAAAPSLSAFLPGKRIMQLGTGSRPSGSRALVSPEPCMLSSGRKESLPTASLTGCPAPWTKGPWDTHSCATLTFPPELLTPDQ